jgi:hypothetical protein
VFNGERGPANVTAITLVMFFYHRSQCAAAARDAPASGGTETELECDSVIQNIYNLKHDKS